MGSVTSPAPSRATVPTLCFTPNLSTEGRSTGSLLIFCKRRILLLKNDNLKAGFGGKNCYICHNSSSVSPLVHQMTRSLSVPLKESGTE